MMEQTMKWACQRPYLDMKELEEWEPKAGISNAEKLSVRV